MGTPLGQQTIGEAFESVAAKRPAPGGGAVAALAGALAGALGRMVVAYSGEIDGAVGERLGESQRRLLELADEDAEAYLAFNGMCKLPVGDPGRGGIAEAARLAAGVPVEIVQESAGVLEVCEEIGGGANTWLLSDLAITAILAEAAARSAAWMVTVNLSGVSEHAGVDAAGEISRACLGALGGTESRLERVLKVCGRAS